MTDNTSFVPEIRDIAKNFVLNPMYSFINQLPNYILLSEKGKSNLFVCCQESLLQMCVSNENNGAKIFSNTRREKTNCRIIHGNLISFFLLSLTPFELDCNFSKALCFVHN